MNAVYFGNYICATVQGGQDQVASKYQATFNEMYSQAWNKVSYLNGHLSFSSADFVNQTLSNRGI